MHRFKTLSLHSILLVSSVMSFAGAARSEPQIFKLAHVSLAPSPGLDVLRGPGTDIAPAKGMDAKQRWQVRHRFNLCLQTETMRQAADLSRPLEAVVGAAFAACATNEETMSAERQSRLAMLLGMLATMQRSRAGETTLAAVTTNRP